MTTTNNNVTQLVVLNNLGLVELERTIASLYARRLITKDEIKVHIHSLKTLVDLLPDLEEVYLH